jgi:hypothetical protein
MDTVAVEATAMAMETVKVQVQVKWNTKSQPQSLMSQ